jgi:hypothetical protein
MSIYSTLKLSTANNICLPTIVGTEFHQLTELELSTVICTLQAKKIRIFAFLSSKDKKALEEGYR